MLTIIIKRNDEPTVIQMTQTHLVGELNQIDNSEMLLEDTWAQGLQKVRTPYVCLVEADCLLSANYISSNVNLFKKMTNGGKNFNGVKGGSHGGGGYSKLAMLSSCLGVRAFDNRIYNYHLAEEEWSEPGYKGIQTKGHPTIQPNLTKQGTGLYPVQVGFVPGAIIRMSALTKEAENILWDDPNLISMSTAVSFYLWNTGRRVEINPNTTYVSNDSGLHTPKGFKLDIPDRVVDIFTQEIIQ